MHCFQSVCPAECIACDCVCTYSYQEYYPHPGYSLEKETQQPASVGLEQENSLVFEVVGIWLPLAVLSTTKS